MSQIEEENATLQEKKKKKDIQTAINNNINLSLQS